jgi:hypothetical protein
VLVILLISVGSHTYQNQDASFFILYSISDTIIAPVPFSTITCYYMLIFQLFMKYILNVHFYGPNNVQEMQRH